VEDDSSAANAIMGHLGKWTVAQTISSELLSYCFFLVSAFSSQSTNRFHHRLTASWTAFTDYYSWTISQQLGFLVLFGFLIFLLLIPRGRFQRMWTSLNIVS